MDDWQLLQDYVGRDSQIAFSTLVNRYVNLVYSVALRQTQDSHVAEEVAQAVFLLLARKARGLRRGVVLSGWLFRTTRFVASRAVRAEQRRQRREHEAFAMQQLNSLDDAWKRISPVLDDALEHLGETDRNVVLLRFFNEKSHRETAAALGISEDAAKKRVTRALDKLRDFFAGRGVTLSVTVITSAVAANAAKAATPEVIASVTAKVAAGSSAAAGILPPLVSQTLNAWRWAKLRIAGAGVVAAIVVGLVLMNARPGQRATSDAALVSSTTMAVTDPPEQDSAVASRMSSRIAVPDGVLRFRVVAADDEQPVAYARLAVNTVTSGSWATRFDLTTDDAGSCDVPVSLNVGRLDVGVIASGVEARFATWRLDKDKAFPSEYTLRVQRVTNFVGGWLRDEAGKPVAGAEVWAQFAGTGDASSRETPRERAGFVDSVPVAKSDRDGRWYCAVIPPANKGYELEARHPDYAICPIASDYAYRANDTNRESLQQLWSTTLITILRRGITLQGQITDQSGQPIAQAQISHEPHSTTALFLTADDHGRFAIPNLKVGSFPITVSAQGFAPEYRDVAVQLEMKPLEVRLASGAVLRLRIVNEDGMEVPDATVGLEQWGEHRHALKWSAKSGPDGRIIWDSAPPNTELQLYARKDGFCYTRDVRLEANDEEHTITLRRALDLNGYVTDAESGNPISEFKVFPGYGEGAAETVWERLDTRTGLNGLFKITFSESRRPWRVRVEAPGYEASISESIPPDFTSTLEIKLKHADAEAAVKGWVLRPDGTPATAAQVALLSLDHNVSLGRAKFRDDGGSLLTNADARGFFEFAADPRAHSVAAVGPAGFARQRLSNPRKPMMLQLQPWGRIEGAVADSARLSPTDSVTFMDEVAMNYQGAVRPDINFWSAKPDASGRFVLEQVPPGEFSLYLNRGIGIPFSCRTEVDVGSGETTVVRMGGKGRTVVGQFAAEAGRIRDWVKQTTYATLSSGFKLPPVPAGLTGDAAGLWAVDFWQSQAGINNYRESRSYSISVAADGSFRAEGVEPGDYDLSATIADAFIKTKVQVPAAAGEVSEVDFGIINLPEILQPPKAAKSSGQ